MTPNIHTNLKLNIHNRLAALWIATNPMVRVTNRIHTNLSLHTPGITIHPTEVRVHQLNDRELGWAVENGTKVLTCQRLVAAETGLADLFRLLILMVLLADVTKDGHTGLINHVLLKLEALVEELTGLPSMASECYLLWMYRFGLQRSKLGVP
jgi:hypothetical protein